VCAEKTEGDGRFEHTCLRAFLISPIDLTNRYRLNGIPMHISDRAGDGGGGGDAFSPLRLRKLSSVESSVFEKSEATSSSKPGSIRCWRSLRDSGFVTVSVAVAWKATESQVRRRKERFIACRVRVFSRSRVLVVTVRSLASRFTSFTVGTSDIAA